MLVKMWAWKPRLYSHRMCFRTSRRASLDTAAQMLFRATWTVDPAACGPARIQLSIRSQKCKPAQPGTCYIFIRRTIYSVQCCEKNPRQIAWGFFLIDDAQFSPGLGEGLQPLIEIGAAVRCRDHHSNAGFATRHGGEAKRHGKHAVIKQLAAHLLG